MKTQQNIKKIQKKRTLSNEKIEELSNYISSSRFRVQENISRFLFFTEGKENLACLTTDISKEGLTVLTREKVKDGVSLFLKLPKEDKNIDLEALWSEKDPLKEGVIHLGLKAKLKSSDLVKSFETNGLLQNKVLYKEADITKFEFKKLQPVISKLHASDKGLLTKLGYSKLIDTHQAYSIRYLESSIVVVMAKTVKPNQFEEFDAYEAAKISFVIKEETAGLGKVRWIKVWPSAGLVREKISAELLLPELVSESKIKVDMKNESNIKNIADVDIEIEDF